MIVASSRNDRFLSNSFLVAARPGDHAVLVDCGAPMQPLLQSIEEHELTLTHVLLTHHHPDHVMHRDAWQQRFDVPMCGHAAERDWFGHLDVEIEDGQELRTGELTIRALHIPGHTVGQLAFVANEERVFTGDTLFRGSVGGTRGKAHTSLADLRTSILDRLLRLPGTFPVHPGHMEDTTIAREERENPFVRYWRGETPACGGAVRVQGRVGTLLVDAVDYDGGRKCQVRFDDDGSEDLVPGSRVERLP